MKKRKKFGRHPHVVRLLQPSGVPGESQLVPRRVDLTQWSPYGVPFESLSVLYHPLRKLFWVSICRRYLLIFDPKNLLILTDGWVMDGWMDGRTGRQSRKKSCIFKISQKLFDIFFLVVSLPPRRVFKTFSEKNSKKNKNFILCKKFRTTFFSAISSIF